MFFRESLKEKLTGDFNTFVTTSLMRLRSDSRMERFVFSNVIAKVLLHLGLIHVHCILPWALTPGTGRSPSMWGLCGGYVSEYEFQHTRLNILLMLKFTL